MVEVRRISSCKVLQVQLGNLLVYLESFGKIVEARTATALRSSASEDNQLSFVLVV